MIELVANLLITTTAAVLFAYWFRWACLLLRSEIAGYYSAARQAPATGDTQSPDETAQESELSGKSK
jgi:hypothetical protein